MSLGDFRLYRLEVAAGRLVGGFAQAVNLDRDALLKL